MSLTYPGGIPLISGAALDETQSSAKMKLGTLRQDEDGNIFKYVKAAEAIALGDVVTPTGLAAWNSMQANGAASSGATTLAVNNASSALTANQYAGYYVSQQSAASVGAAYRIKSHPAIAASGGGTLELETALVEDFADTAALYIFHPAVMELVDANTDPTAGVARVAIASGYYGFVQISGYVQRVNVKTSASGSFAADDILVPAGSATPGSVEGVQIGTPNESEIVIALKSRLISLDSMAASKTGYVSALLSRQF